MKAHRTHDKEAVYVVGLLGWLVPGAGYIYLGQRRRGYIACLAIAGTFLVGVVLGGVGSIGPHYSKAWFVAQVLAGIPALVPTVMNVGGIADALGLSGAAGGVGKGIDLAQLYTGVAGLLNVLCVLDCLLRAQQSGRQRDDSAGVAGTVIVLVTFAVLALAPLLLGGLLSEPVTVGTNVLSLLWALPICLSIALVYKAVKLEESRWGAFGREVAVLFVTIIGFLILVALGLLVIAQFVRR